MLSAFIMDLDIFYHDAGRIRMDFRISIIIILWNEIFIFLFLPIPLDNQLTGALCWLAAGYFVYIGKSEYDIHFLFWKYNRAKTTDYRLTFMLIRVFGDLYIRNLLANVGLELACHTRYPFKKIVC